MTLQVVPSDGGGSCSLLASTGFYVLESNTVPVPNNTAKMGFVLLYVFIRFIFLGNRWKENNVNSAFISTNVCMSISCFRQFSRLYAHAHCQTWL